MKTYNEKIVELNKELEKLENFKGNETWKAEHQDFIQEKINWLNELRAEAIEEVKELQNMEVKAGLKDDCQFAKIIMEDWINEFHNLPKDYLDENAMREFAKRVVIEYLKQKWNITNKEIE